MIKVKRGADISGCRSGILLALIKLESVFGETDVVVTSGSEDYEHSASRSGHYRGDAIDIRSRTTVDKKARTAAIKRKLGPDYVVILESHHWHIHWSPVYHG